MFEVVLLGITLPNLPELLVICAGILGSMIRLMIMWFEKTVPVDAVAVIYHIAVGFACGYLVFLMFTKDLLPQPGGELTLELMAFGAGYLGAKFIKKVVEGKLKMGEKKC